MAGFLSSRPALAARLRPQSQSADLWPRSEVAMKPVPSPTSEELDSQELNALEDDATDILEAANQVQLNDRREQAPKVDADFFNRFDDDADESDMRPAQA